MSLTGTSEIQLAIFSSDGHLQNSAKRRISDLSTKWLAFCHQLLDAHGAAFDLAMDEVLAGFRLRFTSANGAALVAINVGEDLAVSGVLLAGLSSETEQTVCAQFIASVASTPTAQLGGIPHPFSRLTSFAERPLTVIVFWGDEDMAEKDAHAAAELCEHLAAIFFQRALGVVA